VIGKESQKDSDIRADANSPMITVASHRDKDLLTSKCGEFDSLTCSKAGKKEYFSSITFLINEDKFLHVSSMVIDNAIINTGILLYALHLRFMCPFPKRRSRSVHKCKSDTLSAEVRNIVDIEPERSFYLYDDMRVVFPHRHSDSDEGKVCKYIYLKFFLYIRALIAWEVCASWDMFVSLEIPLG